MQNKQDVKMFLSVRFHSIMVMVVAMIVIVVTLVVVFVGRREEEL
jgi:hypothetical protein